MAAGPELRDYATNLATADRNVLEVQHAVEDVHEAVESMQMAIDAVDAIAEMADDFGNTVAKMKRALDLMDKAGPLKALAKVADEVLDQLATVARRIETEALRLAERIDRSGIEDKLERADRKLDVAETRLTVTHAELLARTAAAQATIVTLDAIDRLDGAAQNTTASLAAAADLLVARPNDTLQAINEGYTSVKNLVDGLVGALPEVHFRPVLDVRVDFERIAAQIEFLRGPLNVVSDLLKPIEGLLDAIGLVFKLTVEPVIDTVLETLGIDRLINQVAARITSLLPEVGVLDDAVAHFDAALARIDPLVAAADYLGVAGWTHRIAAELLAPVGNLGTGNLGYGTAAGETLTGSARDEVLDGGPGHDRLLGGAGNDVLIAGDGNDVLDGGAGNDTAVFRGSVLEYTFAAPGGATGSIVFDHLRPSDPRRSDGHDETLNIETYVFADVSLTRSALLGSVRQAAVGQTTLTGTDGTEILYGRTTAITIDGRGGNDIVQGSTASDALLGGAGDDVFAHSLGNDRIDGGSGNDTWRFSVDGASANPDVDADLQRGTIRIGGSTSTVLSVENLVVQDNRNAFLLGDAQANRLVGSSGRDVLDGRVGNDHLNGGDFQDILIGGPGADLLEGGAGDDTLVAGERTVAGVGNVYDGGDGTDTLVYASDLREVLRPEHIPSSVRIAVQLQEASGPLRVRVEAGIVERLAAPGGAVIATDTLISIERIVGSDSNDEMIGADAFVVGLDGGAGNDTLRGGRGGGFLDGGAGNDRLLAGIGNSFDGNVGNDTLDLSVQPGVRWLVRDNGALGSRVIAFNAVVGGQLAVPGGSLQNESGPSVLGAGSIHGIENLIGGADADYVELRGNGRTTVRAGAGDDVMISGQIDGSNQVDFHGEAGDDRFDLQVQGLADGGDGNDFFRLSPSGARVEALGGNGDDVFVISSRAQLTLDGGPGRDVLSMWTIPDSRALVVDLAAGTLKDSGSTPTLGGTVRGIEEVRGNDAQADVLLGSGAAEVFVVGGGNDRLEGRGGRDLLWGGAGNDTLRGGDGDDMLHGGPGNDLLDGGAGSDTASWAYAMPGVTVGVFQPSSFGRVEVDLAAGTARLITSGGNVESDTMVSIENLTGGPGNDVLRGDAGANLLAGGPGEDQLDGRGGDDTLVLDGNDRALGGDGGDRFIVGPGNVVIDGGAGTDTLDFGNLRGSVEIDVAGGAYVATFEVQQPVWRDGGGTAARSVGGVSLTPQQVLEADAAHADSPDDFTRVVPADPRLAITYATVMQRAGGSFTGIERFASGVAELRFYALSGAERLEGSTTTVEMVDLSRRGNAVALDLVNSAFEAIDVIIGTRFDDRLAAGATAVRLEGGAGRDELIGGPGVDTLVGGDGDDTYRIGASDLVVEASGGGRDIVYVQADYGLPEHVEDLVVQGTAGLILYGNASDNTVHGGPGADTLQGLGGHDVLEGGDGADLLDGGDGNDTLQGGAGGDRLQGGAGDDLLDGGPGADQLVGGVGDDMYVVDHAGDTIVESAGGGRDTVRTLLSLVLPDQVDVGIVEGAQGLVLVGNGLDNLLRGGPGNDRLDGGDGDDRLEGGAGDDWLVGTAGHNLLIGGPGDDTYEVYGDYTTYGLLEEPGGGHDRVVITRWAGDAFPPLRDHIEDLVIEIDTGFSAQGNDAANRMSGGGGPDHLEGLRGDDRIEGGGGDDTLSGSDGRDTLLGQAGNDRLYGGPDDDHLDGGDGDDWLDGGPGDDRLEGGAGLDVARYADKATVYSVVRAGAELVVAGGLDGRDALVSVERIVFGDGGRAFDLDGDAGEVARLLGAVFGPAAVSDPRMAGVGLGLLDGGMSTDELAAYALQAAGANSPQQVVDRLWTNVVGTAPTAAEAQPYIDQLDSGAVTPAALALMAAHTPLNEARIDLVGLADAGLPFIG